MLEVDQIRYQNTFRQVSVVRLRAVKTISFMYLNNIFSLNIQFKTCSVNNSAHCPSLPNGHPGDIIFCGYTVL